MREQAALSNAPEGYLDFHDEYAELIAELAALGFTPTQVLRRLNFLYPHINKKHLNYALDSGIWQFYRSRQTPRATRCSHAASGTFSRKPTICLRSPSTRR